MTVQYARAVHTTTVMGFLKILFRWKGSIYKLMWADMLLFLGLYYGLTFIGKYLITDPVSIFWFELVVRYCKRTSDAFNDGFNLALMFFVMAVTNRFFVEFGMLPWTQSLAMTIITYIRSQPFDDTGRLIRRAILRYVCAGVIMLLSTISIQIKRRFPTFNHITQAGLLTEREQQLIDNHISKNDKHLIPFAWANTLILKAKQEGTIKDNIAVSKLMDMVRQVSGNCGGIWGMDCMNLPLLYTQVITITVYAYFAVVIVGYLPTRITSEKPMWPFPYITIAKFIIYRGWLKVAEQSISPLGDDDDDFDLNPIVDRLVHEAFLIGDGLYDVMPELKKDIHWGETIFEIPYTKESAKFKVDKFVGSSVSLWVPDKLQKSKFVRKTQNKLKGSKKARKSRTTKAKKSGPKKRTKQTKTNKVSPEREELDREDRTSSTFRLVQSDDHP